MNGPSAPLDAPFSAAGAPFAAAGAPFAAALASPVGRGLRTQPEADTARLLARAEAASRGAGMAQGGDRELRSKTAREFESVFLRMLLDRMMPDDSSGLFGDGPSAGVVRGLFVERLGDQLASRSSLGIAGLIEKELSIGSKTSREEAPAGAPGPEAISVDAKA